MSFRYVLFLLVSYLVLFSYVWAEGEVVEKFPMLKIKNSVFDFGTVSQGSKVIHDFEIYNKGDAPLKIERVVPACGCTATSLSEDTIKPGESGKIHVEFNTAGFSGEKIKTVRVYSNDMKNPNPVLSLKGTIMPDVIINPKRVFWGEVSLGPGSNMEPKEVTVEVREGANVKIADITTRCKYLVIEKIESGAKKSRFKISISPDTTKRGDLRERVVVTLKGGKKSSINIPVFASIIGNLRLNPSSLSFGILQGTEVIKRSVKFENKSSESVKITRIKSNHSAVSANYKTIKKGKLYVIEVLVDPRRVRSGLRASLDILTDSKDQERVSLSVYGILAPKG